MADTHIFQYLQQLANGINTDCFINKLVLAAFSSWSRILQLDIELFFKRWRLTGNSRIFFASSDPADLDWVVMLSN